MKYHAEALPEGTLISEFRIIGLAGLNRFGFIYLGLDEATHRKVIIREFFPRAIVTRRNGISVGCDPSQAERMGLAINRLERLGSRLCRFNHPNFVETLRFSRDHGTAYLILANDEGMTLGSWLHARSNPPAVTDLRPIMEPILDALSSMHRLGGVHQDITPQSIMVRPDGRPILAGQPTLAEVVAIVEQQVGKTADVAQASPGYMAPEQTPGAVGLGLRTDIYAVGAVLYRALVGMPPVDARERERNIRAAKADPYVPLASALHTNLPLVAAAAIDRAVCLRAKERLNSIDELRVALGWLQTSDPQPRTQRQKTHATMSSMPWMEHGKESRRLACKALSLSQLSAARNKAAVLPATASLAAPEAAVAVASWSGLRSTSFKSWAGAFLMVGGAGVAAVELQSGARVLARISEQPTPPDQSGNSTLIAALGIIVAGALVAWFSRTRIRSLVTLVRERLRNDRARTERGLREDRPQVVDASVFAPLAAAAGDDVLVQVYLHVPDDKDVAAALAREADAAENRRGIATLTVPLVVGQRVQIVLEAPGLELDESVQSLVWTGDPCACQFLAHVPQGARGQSLQLRVRLLLESVPIGALRFTIAMTKMAADQPLHMRGDTAHRYRHAFLSYASPDRAEVLKRAQVLKAVQIDFFQDLLTLQPGERWRQRLYEEIDRCDLFLLFWSSYAAGSEWVTREAEYALARHRKSPSAIPDIIPIILEGPPVPLPPGSLKEIHFNDFLRYVIAAVEAAPPKDVR